jgi:hypothetical protein
MSSPATFDDALGPDEWEAVPVTGADLEDNVSARYRNTETNFMLEICAQSGSQFFHPCAPADQCRGVLDNDHLP